MTTYDMPENTIHHGRNVQRFREMLRMKQEGLAFELGDDWNQKKVSLLEQKEVIDDKVLEQVAQVLKVPVEAIKNFDEEKAIYNIQNNYEGSNNGVTTVSVQNYHCTFNPIEKIVELYEALVKSEKEKVEMLQRLLEERK